MWETLNQSKSWVGCVTEQPASLLPLVLSYAILPVSDLCLLSERLGCQTRRAELGEASK